MRQFHFFWCSSLFALYRSRDYCRIHFPVLCSDLLAYGTGMIWLVDHRKLFLASRVTVGDGKFCLIFFTFFFWSRDIERLPGSPDYYLIGIEDMHSRCKVAHLKVRSLSAKKIYLCMVFFTFYPACSVDPVRVQESYLKLMSAIGFVLNNHLKPWKNCFL